LISVNVPAIAALPYHFVITPPEAGQVPGPLALRSAGA
jgi:hypothetical protein